jgi:hypothetical protein
MTEPYAPISDGICRNRGFANLRGRPERANEKRIGYGKGNIPTWIRLSRPNQAKESE